MFKGVKHPFLEIITIIGVGFLYNSITGSNNEIQINKVLWHSTRSTNSILFLISSFFLLKNNYKMTNIFLCADIIFSIFYRIITKQ